MKANEWKMQLSRVCESCDGIGMKGHVLCPVCRGDGKEIISMSLKDFMERMLVEDDNGTLKISFDERE